MRTKLKIHSLAQPDFCARAKGNLNISLSADKKRRWRGSQNRRRSLPPGPRRPPNGPPDPFPDFGAPEHRYEMGGSMHLCWLGGAAPAERRHGSCRRRHAPTARGLGHVGPTPDRRRPAPLSAAPRSFPATPRISSISNCAPQNR